MATCKSDFLFSKIKNHKGKSLITDILDILEKYDTDISNCRGQAYDYATNMSGKYSGLQARLKEQRELAFYILCTGLRREVQSQLGHQLYQLFSRSAEFVLVFVTSTHRWDLLKGKHATLKCLLDTRWPCRSDASKSLVEKFDAALCLIAEDSKEKSDIRHEVVCLLNKITNLEFSFMALLWNHLLKRFNEVSKFLQKVELGLHTTSSMLLSVIDIVKNIRDLRMNRKNLARLLKKDYYDKNKRKIIKKLSNAENQVDTLNISDNLEDFFSHKKEISETKNTLTPLHVLNWIVETDIIDVFPNVYIAYRLFLTIPITKCEAERLFSALK
ncbi:zinc finger MYM-type protein 6-like [Hydra vulgaris]|uniref:zinc finger MYM-type protein 6-like n=1 Tax=Hydra vulgaris TaxID=6087 RepID=UPI0032EA265C